MLIIFSGLPGTGKTTIARSLARRLGAVYLRADTVEQAMREWGLTDSQIGGMGYGVSYSVATENLGLGLPVIADTVNPWPITREAWREAAELAGSAHLDIEIVCSDAAVHRDRVEKRKADIPGFSLPTWQDVIERDYRSWTTERLVIDTAILSVDEAVEKIIEAIG